MPALKRLILALLLGAVSLLVNGCAIKEDTTIPWSRPQPWEGQVPGMGSSPGAGG